MSNFNTIKGQYELLMAHAAIDFDKLNISCGTKTLEEAARLKPQLLELADLSDFQTILWLATHHIITQQELYEYMTNQHNHDHIKVNKNLNKLSEECGELVQIVNKVLDHGIDSYNPKTGEGNYELLQKEMTDVIASVRRTAKLMQISLPDDMIDSRVEKLIRLYG